MKKILFSSLVAGLLLSSCTEVPIIVDTTVRGKDTTYVAAVEAPQAKKILAEELSGVECVNCPAGSKLLHDANASGPAAGKLVIVSIHSGDLTTPIHKEGKESKYDFRTDVGMQIVNSILGGDIGKPCAGFDRLPIAISGGLEGKVLDYRNNWEKMIEKSMEINGTAPVNITISSKSLTADSYEIQVKVSYTKEMAGRQALTVYMTESGMNDYQMFPTEIKLYDFEHVFRTSVSPFSGMEILPDLTTKEAGRVFIQNFVLNIDRSDPKQASWVDGNMSIVAFVHNLDASDKRVFQVQEAPLK